MVIDKMDPSWDSTNDPTTDPRDDVDNADNDFIASFHQHHLLKLMINIK